MITRTRNAGLEESLERWQRAGVINGDAAQAIREYEHRSVFDAPKSLVDAANNNTHRRVPVLSEALGYLGGMLGVVGVVLLVTRYWPNLGAPGHMALAGGAAILLLVAGLLVPHHDEPALERLRSFVWLGATAATALSGGVFAHDVVGTQHPSTIVLTGAAAATMLSAALWWRHDRPVQQTTFLVGLLVSVGVLGDLLFVVGINGVLVWTVAATMLAVGVIHGCPRPVLALGVGAAGAMIGAAMTITGSRGDGLLFFLLTTCAVLALGMLDLLVATRLERRLLLIMGTFAALQAVPQTAAWFARDAGIATGLTVFAVGAALLMFARLPAVRTQLAATMLGGASLVAGAAITGAESAAFATTFGLVVAVALIGLGTLPDQVLLSLFGCAGLLVNVPWAISHFFPGEGRAPLLIAVSGVLIVAVAVWLSRQSQELHHQFRRH